MKERKQATFSSSYWFGGFMHMSAPWPETEREMTCIKECNELWLKTLQEHVDKKILESEEVQMAIWLWT